MDTVYYYLRMEKQFIKKISGIDYKKPFPNVNPTANLWNMSDDESDEEESISNNHTDYSENLCFVISKLWIERDKHINTNYLPYTLARLF